MYLHACKLELANVFIVTHRADSVNTDDFVNKTSRLI